MRKDSPIPALLLVITAAIVKLVYLFGYFDNPGNVAALSIDAYYHYNWAAAIASGDFLANTPFFRAPLYPFFIALLLKVSGYSLIFVRLIQLLAGCLSIFLIYEIARTLTDRRIALAAGLLYLLYPLTTFFEGELLLDSTFTLLILLSVHSFIGHSHKTRHAVLTGLFFGLAALTRPTILVFLPIISLAFWKFADRSGTKPIGLITRFIVTTLIVIAPVTIVNYMTSQQFTLISYQGGINFYLGNNPEADGLYANLPDVGGDWTLDDIDYLAKAETGQELLYGEQSAFWYKKGLAFILDSPMEFLGLYAKKVFFFFSGHEISNNRDLNKAISVNSLLSVLPVRLYLIIGLAVLPMIWASRYRKMSGLILGAVLFFGLIVSLFFVTSRFRLPVIPFLCITAGIGLVSVIDAVVSKRPILPLIVGLLVAGVIAMVSISHPFPFAGTDPRYDAYTRGNAALRMGDYTRAAELFESLCNEVGYYRNACVNLGIARLKQGNADEAMESFARELEKNPRSAEALNNIAAVYLVGGHPDSAMSYARAALAIKPYYKEAAMNLLRAAEADTMLSRQVEAVRSGVRSHLRQSADYVFEEGLYFTTIGRIPEAIDNHIRVLELLDRRDGSTPFDLSYAEKSANQAKLRKLANYQLGYLYGLTGRYELSVHFSREAIAIDSLLREAYINLISGYRSLGDAVAADSVIDRYLALWPET